MIYRDFCQWLLAQIKRRDAAGDAAVWLLFEIYEQGHEACLVTIERGLVGRHPDFEELRIAFAEYLETRRITQREWEAA